MPELMAKNAARIVDQLTPAVGEMRVMTERGDVRVTWNARDTDEVEAARKQFDELRDKRFQAFAVTGEGGKGEQISEFDENAQKLIMCPPMAGGC